MIYITPQPQYTNEGTLSDFENYFSYRIVNGSKFCLVFFFHISSRLKFGRFG